MKTIPTKLEELTAEYLTTAFKQSGVLIEGKIESISHKKDNVGVNSTSGHFVLNYSAESTGEKPEKVFIKLNGKNQAKREYNIYKFLEEQKVDLDIFVECYFLDINDDEDQAIIVLKDYKDFHQPPIDLAAFVPRKNVPDDEPFKNMVEAMAKLHAHWWEDHKLFTYKDRITNLGWNPETDLKAEYQSLWGKFYEKEKTWLPKETIEIFEHALENFERVWDDYYLERMKANRHFTLVNGDGYFHQFLCLNEKADTKVKMIDLNMCIGTPADDLVHLILKKLNPAQRYHNNREQNLLKYYHDCMVKYGVSNYSLEDIILEYRVEVYFLLFFAIWDYSYQGSDDPYWWYKFQNVNHAFMDLKCNEL